MDFETIFFRNWVNLGRTALVGVLAYAALIVLLRVSGKRTLSKMNAFDLIVTVALGSTLATVLLSKDVALAEGVLAFAVLIGLQFAITWLSVRSKTIAGAVKGEPTLLLHRGQFLEAAMRRERVLRKELLAAIRSRGINEVDQVDAVVLETDGSFSVTSKSGTDPHPSALQDVNGIDSADPLPGSRPSPGSSSGKFLPTSPFPENSPKQSADDEVISSGGEENQPPSKSGRRVNIPALAPNPPPESPRGSARGVDIA